MRGSRGFTIVEILIVLTIISLLAAMSVPLYATAIKKSRTSAMIADCRHIYDAMIRYRADIGQFPSEDEFDKSTLSPLSTEGYLSQADSITRKLQGEEILIYLAPDVDGQDQQFIIVNRHKTDPTVIVVAVQTDIIDDTDGWVDGVYVITEEDLADADEL